MKFDPQAVARHIAEVAEEEILPRFRTLSDSDVREKQSGELVTIADIETEHALSARLRGCLQGSSVVGEEAVAAKPDLLDHLETEGPIWIIDPVDGTSNFAAGKPTFAVMVALIHGGETLAAWIHDPVAGRTLTAEHGAGAWIGGHQVKVAEADSPSAMTGTLHASTYATPEIARKVQARRGRVQTIKSLRCAGHEYLRLAEGRMHFSLFTRLMPWDHVPGSLIQTEAGGIAWTLDGAPYRATSHRLPGLLLAPDETAWRALRDTLLGPD